jgi:hypothetical protein
MFCFVAPTKHNKRHFPECPSASVPKLRCFKVKIFGSFYCHDEAREVLLKGKKAQYS